MSKENKENKENTENTPKNESITLDGKAVTLKELSEAQKNPSVRIIEDGVNSYKTLVRMQG